MTMKLATPTPKLAATSPKFHSEDYLDDSVIFYWTIYRIIFDQFLSAQGKYEGMLKIPYEGSYYIPHIFVAPYLVFEEFHQVSLPHRYYRLSQK
jgi:hypothetical protein